MTSKTACNLDMAAHPSLLSCELLNYLAGGTSDRTLHIRHPVAGAPGSNASPLFNWHRFGEGGFRFARYVTPPWNCFLSIQDRCLGLKNGVFDLAKRAPNRLVLHLAAIRKIFPILPNLKISCSLTFPSSVSPRIP